MMLTELFEALNAAGIRLARIGHQLELDGPAGSIIPTIRAGIIEHKAALLALLPCRSSPVPAPSPNGVVHPPSGWSPTPVPPTPGPVCTVATVGTKDYPYKKGWDGQVLPVVDYVGLDCETTPIEDRFTIPRLVLVSVSAGDAINVVIPADQVGRFLLAHTHVHFVCHNIAFDFAVINEHLKITGEEGAREAWWSLCDRDRLHDTEILDMLIELARADAEPVPRGLDVVAKLYTGMILDKGKDEDEDHPRKRFAELIGKDWDGVDERFFQYAVAEPVATLATYRAMLPVARELAVRGSGGVFAVDDAWAKWGPLTEHVQVKGAIALSYLERFGMHVDPDRVRKAAAKLRRDIEELTASMHPRYPGLFKVERPKKPRKPKKGQVAEEPPAAAEPVLCWTAAGAPSLSGDGQQRLLQGVLDERRAAGQEVAIPRTPKTGKLSTKEEDWSDLAAHGGFVEEWLRLKRMIKRVPFYAGLRGSVVHPHYGVMTRTGRATCGEPNIQQIPHEPEYREVFIPYHGHFFLIADYSAIELRTLAVHCSKALGRSVLGDVIREGRDPHAFTAAMVLGVPYDEFRTWKGDGSVVEINGVEKPLKDHYADARTAAKPINFGVPGSMGPASLAASAKKDYGVRMTVERADELRTLLISAVYPELGEFLDEDPMALLARNLGRPIEAVRAAFDPKGANDPRTLGGVRNVVRGKMVNAKNQPYRPSYLNQVWSKLQGLGVRSELFPMLIRRQAGEDLWNRLFGSSAVTWTGRVRANTSYGQSHNTPFQGPAADGAKLALYRLIREGYRVVAFVHDEFVIEMPDEGGYVSRGRIDRITKILCDEMEEVLGGTLPAAVEATLSTCWSKRAGLIVEGDKVLPWSPPSEEGT
jgi:hypothetical protein